MLVQRPDPVEPYLRLYANRDYVTVGIKNKPLGSTADVRLFSVGEERDALEKKEFLDTWDCHAEFMELKKGNYRVTAVIHLENGGKKILEEFCTVDGENPHNLC